MAKLLCFVAVLLVASAVLAEAHTAPAPAPAATKPAAPAPAPHGHGIPWKNATFSLKFIIHNVADTNVTFKLEVQGKDAGYPAVAKAGQWTGIGPLKVARKVAVVQLYVTVKNNKGVAVTKGFPVFLKGIVANSSKALVVTASEVKSWKGKSLVIKIGRKVELIFKL
jgi:hypothetical protein